jgi:putative transcriptional regulator
MKSADTTKRTDERAKASDTDWGAFDAMTEEERHRAALLDPDARPMSDGEWARMRKTPQAKIIRRALGLTPEEFSTRYQIPLRTLADWEDGRSQPDDPARAYLRIIAHDPEGVQKILKLRAG